MKNYGREIIEEGMYKDCVYTIYNEKEGVTWTVHIAEKENEPNWVPSGRMGFCNSKTEAKQNAINAIDEVTNV